MAITHYHHILIIVMIVASSINILSKNWSIGLESPGSDGIKRKFDHPFVQCWLIFLGEILCLIAFKLIFKYCPTRQVVNITEKADPENRVYFRRVVYSQVEVEWIQGDQNFNPFLFFPPAMLCMIATPIMYVGLTYSPSFQALLGPSIIFVALLSRRPVRMRPIIFMMVGLIIISLGNVLGSKDDYNDYNGLITGVLLIVISQILTTFQIVYEENYLVDKDIPPLQAVGWEGIFGLAVSSFLLVPFYFIKVGYPFAENSRGVLEDFPDAMTQIYYNPWLLVSCVGIVISIAFSNFAAMSLTKEVSALSRVIINVLTCIMFQGFDISQAVGFIVVLIGVVYGALLYLEEESSRSDTSSEHEDDESIN